jgi:peptidoglycan-associated lipoprotein
VIHAPRSLASLTGAGKICSSFPIPVDTRMAEMTRLSGLVVITLSLMALLITGCAKRPALSQAAAPPPTGAVTAQPPAPAPAPAAAPAPAPVAPPPAAVPAPAPPAAPRPEAFAEAPGLKDIRFDFDRYDIRPGDAKILDADAEWLRSHADQVALIEGHCDERGTNEYNLALGERRANAAKSYLVSKDLDAGRISVVSYGEERPVCTEHNEVCWAKNRRAHFLVKGR